MKLKLTVLLSICLFYSFFTKAQAIQDSLLAKSTVILGFYGDSILKAKSDSTRHVYLLRFHQLMDSVVGNPLSFNHSFSSVKNLSVLSSEDKKLRIYTWMIPAINGMSFDFFGYVQVMSDKNKLKVYKLNEKKYLKNDEAEYVKLADSAWYGALYYNLLHRRYDKKDQYILLGWHGKDAFSTRKVMDCVVVTPSKIEFGKAVFKTSGKTKSRVILEYNAQANVSLNYNESAGMIIHDHLSPSDPRPEAKGVYSLYGPDLSYDGWKFKDGLWYHQKNVIVKNKKEGKQADVKLHHDMRMQRKVDH